MSRKAKWAIAAAMLFLFAGFFATLVYERPYRNALLEMRMDTSRLVWGNNYRAYRFVVLNNGRLVSYSGLTISPPFWQDRFTMWPIVRKRSRITLNDEDFQNISEMALRISKDYAMPLRIMSMWQMELLLDGNWNIYRGGLEFYQIADELLRLSPLTSERFWIDPYVIEAFGRD